MTILSAFLLLVLISMLSNWNRIKWELEHGLGALIAIVFGTIVSIIIVLGLLVFALHQL